MKTCRNVRVATDGVPKKYDIEIEWSGDIQGFSIIDIIPK